MQSKMVSGLYHGTVLPGERSIAVKGRNLLIGVLNEGIRATASAMILNLKVAVLLYKL